MITLDETIKSIIASDLYSGSSVDIETATKYTLNDYEDSLVTTLHTLKSLPIDSSSVIKTIEHISTLIDSNYEDVMDGIATHIHLLRLEKIL